MNRTLFSCTHIYYAEIINFSSGIINTFKFKTRFQSKKGKIYSEVLVSFCFFLPKEVLVLKFKNPC